MDTGLNEGIANTLIVRAEQSLAGTLTGSSYAVDGRVAFSHEPVLDGNLPGRNVWRAQDGDSYAARSFRATLDMEWAHGELTALLLSSLLRRSGSTPNYTFRPGNLSFKQTLAVGFGYVPNGVEIVLRGVIVESLQLAFRPREITRARWRLAAAKLTTDGPIASIASGSIIRAVGQSDVEYGGASNPRVYDFSVEIAQPVDFGNFGEDGTPVDYDVGPCDVSVELAEWLANSEPAGQAIAQDAREQDENSLSLEIAPAAGKVLRFEIPRMLVRSGTPPLFQPGGIGYRASTEAQSSEDRSDLTVVTMTI